MEEGTAISLISLSSLLLSGLSSYDIPRHRSPVASRFTPRRHIGLIVNSRVEGYLSEPSRGAKFSSSESINTSSTHFCTIVQAFQALCGLANYTTGVAGFGRSAAISRSCIISRTIRRNSKTTSTAISRMIINSRRVPCCSLDISRRTLAISAA